MLSFETFSSVYTPLIDHTLDQILSFDLADGRERLSQAMRYSVLAKGKRIRPLLCVATFLLFSEKPKPIYPVATCLELMHTYSLIHDDLPAMDDDTLRRGCPTCHIQFDEATAILAGDTLNTLTFEILATHLSGSFHASHILKAITLLARSCGVYGMAGGQMLDLTVKSQSEYDILQIHRLKTGALIQASILIPAVLSGVSEEVETHLGAFGAHLGLLFQMVDDILDVTACSQTLGKTALKDIAQEKSTFVSALGLETAQKRVAQQHDLALSELRKVAALGYAIETLESALAYTCRRAL